jgi:hypothetical protein
MSRRGAWIVAGLLFLAVVTITVSSLMAQVWNPGPAQGGQPPGRFQVVSSAPDGVVLLDTATGELYKAGPGDIKPYYMRPRVGQPDFGRDRDRFVDKDAPPRDIPKDFRDLPKDFPRDLKADGKPLDKTDRKIDDKPPRDLDKKPTDFPKDGPKDKPVDKPPRDFDKKPTDFKDKPSDKEKLDK